MATSLLNLDPALVQQAHALLLERLRELVPELDSGRGVLGGTTLQLNSILQAWMQDQIDTLQKSFSLKQVLANPALGGDTQIDLLAANFRITRQQGGIASGKAAVVLPEKRSFVVPAGELFESSTGLTFAATQTFTGLPALPSSPLPGDRALRQLTSGWAFNIDLICTTPGSEGNLRLGATLQPQGLQGIVRVHASTSFAGGSDRETNSELLDRLDQGMASRGGSSRAAMSAIVANAGWPRAQLSIVGFGDVEQQRYHGLLPVAHGGRVDLWVRTAAWPALKAVTLDATLIDITAKGGLWQLNLGRKDAPGYQEVLRVLPDGSDLSGSSSLEIHSDLRSFDTGSDFHPDVTTPQEAAYTVYQTGAVRFFDPATITGLTIGSTIRPYIVVCSVMPDLAKLQDLWASREQRPLAGDILVRAAVCCRLTATVVIARPRGSALPTTLAGIVARATAANGFGRKLPLARLAQAAQGVLLSGQRLEALEASGRLRRPDGEIVTVAGRGGSTLEVPEDITALTTDRTVVYALDPTDVTVIATDG